MWEVGAEKAMSRHWGSVQRAVVLKKGGAAGCGKGKETFEGDWSAAAASSRIIL